MKKSLLKKIILSAVIFAGAISSVDGQTEPDFLWAKKAGGKSRDGAWCISVDASGNSYIGGSFQDTATFGNATLINNKPSDDDAFIAKLDGNGNFLWVVKAGGNYDDMCTAISTDAAGNCYAAGFFKSDTLYIGNYKIKNNGGGRSIFITKIDANGSVKWVKTGSALDANAIYTTASGISYITGEYSGPIEFDRFIPSTGTRDIFILKMDADGNYISTKTAGGDRSDDNAYGIYIDAEMNWAITGYYRGGAIKFYKRGGGTINLAASGSYDGFAAKLDTAGYCLWAMSFATKRYKDSRGQCITGDAAGNTYIAGVFQDTITIGTIKLISPPKSPWDVYDGFIAKIDAGGNVLWAKHINEDAPDMNPYPHGLYTDVLGNSYIAGFNYIMKIAANGDSLWTKQIINAGGSNSGAECRGVDFDANGNCYVAGRFIENTTFGNISITPYGDRDAFVTKLDNTGNEVGIKDAVKNNFSIYPNPASEFVTLTNLSNSTSVSITDLAGKQVYSTTANATELSINTSGFANGVYLVNIGNNGSVATKKLIVNK